jgi:hypothetical protein
VRNLARLQNGRLDHVVHRLHKELYYEGERKGKVYFVDRIGTVLYKQYLFGAKFNKSYSV